MGVNLENKGDGDGFEVDSTGATFGIFIGKQKLFNIHLPERCEGHGCSIHHPSAHHMVDWPMLWRSDRLLMERICSHQVSHPDPDDLVYQKSIGIQSAGIHGCCEEGCCVAPQWVDDENDEPVPYILSPRQLEIISLLAEGYTQLAVARRLFIEMSTIKTHMESALRRTEARNTVQLVAIAIRNRWID